MARCNKMSVDKCFVCDKVKYQQDSEKIVAYCDEATDKMEIYKQTSPYPIYKVEEFIADPEKPILFGFYKVIVNEKVKKKDN